MTTLLRQRQADQLAARSRRGEAAPSSEVVEVAAHREITALRKELHSLVGAWARRTSQPHATVHAELRRLGGGPEVPKASSDQLRGRIAMIRNWHVGKR